MTRKQRRLGMVALGAVALGLAAILVLNAFDDSLAFFFSPSEVEAKHVPDGRRIRLGGLVEEGSFKKLEDGVTMAFSITDGAKSIPVRYKGLLPDLFREGQGVVTEGALQNGTFIASTVLAKHDENYMPPEVAESLKKTGHWQDGKEEKE